MSILDHNVIQFASIASRAVNSRKRLIDQALRETPTNRDAAPCFTAGTEIIAKDGAVKVENIKIGDQILTADNGFKPVSWVGCRTVSKEDLEQYPHLRPITIAKGTFGNSKPMSVSPQHGMALRSNGQEQLVRAKYIPQMFGPDAAYIDSEVTEVTYYHIMFDQHELVFAEGALTEAFYPGPSAIGSLDQDARAELLHLFPELADIWLTGVNAGYIFGDAARSYSDCVPNVALINTGFSAA